MVVVGAQNRLTRLKQELNELKEAAGASTLCAAAVGASASRVSAASLHFDESLKCGGLVVV